MNFKELYEGGTHTPGIVFKLVQIPGGLKYKSCSICRLKVFLKVDLRTPNLHFSMSEESCDHLSN